MDRFLDSFKSVRETPNLVPSSNKGFPKELHEMAKELVKNSQHRYSVLPIYTIILDSLRNNKTIQDIKNGLLSISKYPLCLYLDQDRPEFHQIRTFSGYYTYELKEKLDSFEQILEALGYSYDEPSQLYKLDDKIRMSKTFDDKIAKIGCDLVLALEELDLYVEMSKDNPIDPVVHFSARVPQLQQNYEPTELQYGQNPGVPPDRPSYEGQRYRNEPQNQYSNIPQQGYQGQLSNNPDPPRYQPPGSQEPYLGMQHGLYSDPLYLQQDPNLARNQPLYQGQGPPYNTSSFHETPNPYQNAPSHDPRSFPKPGQTPHRTDPSDTQGRNPRQEQTVQPYHQNPDYNQNSGNTRHDMNPPMLQGQDPVNPVYGHPDAYAQSQPTHEPVYPMNPTTHEYNPPINYGQNPSGTQGDSFARQAPNPHDNPSHRYADAKPNIPDPVHNANRWRPGQDIRYSQNRQEQAEVDVIPARRTQPNLFQGNEFSGGAQPQDGIYGNMPRNRPNEGRDAGNDNTVGERIAEYNRIHLDKQGPPLGEPHKDTRRDAGLSQGTVGNLGYSYPPNTPDKPGEFQITPSRDADEGSKGKPPPAMYSGRDVSEIPDQSENYRRSRDFSNQNPGGLTPALSDPQFESQKIGIHSNTPRGTANPAVTPKNTQLGNERTMDQPGKKDDFAMTAFTKSESSEVHELDEKRSSREHNKFSGVKEQGSNSPRQQSPMPANTPGNANTGGMQSANPQHGTQYGGTEARGPYDNNQYPYHQHVPVANPGQIEEPGGNMPPPRMPNPNQGFGDVSNPIHRPPDMHQGYRPPLPSQYENPDRPLPLPVAQDFTQGVGNMRMPNPVDRPQDVYPRNYNLPPNQGAYPNQFADPHRPLPTPNTEPPADAVAYHGQVDEPNRHLLGYKEDFSQGIDNMRIGNTGNIPQDVYPREYNLPPNQGAYPNQYPDPHRPLPHPKMEDFSQKIDSSQFQNRQPAKTYSATGEAQSNLRYGNEPFNAMDNTAYKATGQDPPIDPYGNDPLHQKRQYTPKDDFSQPVSDKNTGINDPNPDRNKPPVHHPYQREDPRVPHPLGYPIRRHDEFPYDDELEMMEGRRHRDMAMKEAEQTRIMDMKRMREHAAYDEPHYPRQHLADPAQHRPYEAPYQPPAPPPAPTTEWTCAHCTLINPPGTRVCNACAKTVASLPQAVAPPMNTLKCTHCMTYNPATARMCTDCGRGLF